MVSVWLSGALGAERQLLATFHFQVRSLLLRFRQKRPRKIKLRAGAPGAPLFPILLLAGLLAQGSSYVRIFLHHESGVGGTQVVDHGGGYIIDDHGNPAVRTDRKGAISTQG